MQISRRCFLKQGVMLGGVCFFGSGSSCVPVSDPRFNFFPGEIVCSGDWLKITWDLDGAEFDSNHVPVIKLIVDEIEREIWPEEDTGVVFEGAPETSVLVQMYLGVDSTVPVLNNVVFVVGADRPVELFYESGCLGSETGLEPGAKGISARFTGPSEACMPVPNDPLFCKVNLLPPYPLGLTPSYVRNITPDSHVRVYADSSSHWSLGPGEQAFVGSISKGVDDWGACRFAPSQAPLLDELKGSANFVVGFVCQ